jgi:hypothetical protein
MIIDIAKKLALHKESNPVAGLIFLQIDHLSVIDGLTQRSLIFSIDEWLNLRCVSCEPCFFSRSVASVAITLLQIFLGLLFLSLLSSLGDFSS